MEKTSIQFLFQLKSRILMQIVHVVVPLIWFVLASFNFVNWTIGQNSILFVFNTYFYILMRGVHESSLHFVSHKIILLLLMHFECTHKEFLCFLSLSLWSFSFSMRLFSCLQEFCPLFKLGKVTMLSISMPSFIVWNFHPKWKDFKDDKNLCMGWKMKTYKWKLK